MRSGTSISINAERGGSRSGVRRGADDPPKRKPNLRKVLPEIWVLIRPRRWLLAGGMVLMVINRVSSLVLPGSTKFLIDNILRKGDGSKLPLLVGIVFAATAVQAVTSFSLTQLLSKAAQRLITDLRKQVQEHIGRLAVSFYDSNRTGTLVSRIMTDVEGVRNLIGTGLVDFLGGLLTAVLASILLFRTSRLITTIVFAVLLVFVFLLQKAFKVIRPIFRERAKINAEVTGRLTESLGGVRVVKGYHAEDREAVVFGAGVQKLLDNVLKSLTALSLMGLSSTLMLGIVSSIILYMGSRQIFAGHMTTGSLFAYTLYMGFLVAPVAQIASIGTQITEALAGLDRTREVLGENREDEDPERTTILPVINGRIEFEHVDFSYEEGKPVLDDVSFVSEPGSVTALVGSSGSGKSTIIGLVAAFYKPTSGRVTVDNIDLAHVRLDSYRSALGVVLQDSFLFDGSIRENIAFSRPDATEAQIMEACHIAHVDEFAERFKDKYDTIIGERGVKLSGGQKQRVSIARAVLADPRVLILDEATSSLDSESEAYIQQGLKYLMEGRTTFVIAHRLSTIRQADQILVVEAGKIVERGKHETLLAEQGRYHDLYTRQHGLETNLFLAPGEGDTVEDTNGAKRGGGPAGPDAMSIISGRGL